MQNLKIFAELKSTNSIVEKEAILKKYKDDKLVKELLSAALNPERLFQFNKMPNYETIPNVSSRPIYLDFLDLLKKLENREVTGNDAKEAVTSCFSRMSKQDALEYSKVLLKAPIGVTAKTVNKVWPGLIPEFTLMLAPNDLADVTKVKYPIYVQPKLDGYRCVYKQGNMWSRAGKPFGNKRLAEYFNTLFTLNEYVLDGELYAEGEHFNKLQTILNTYEAPLPNSLKFIVYDCIPTPNWESKNYTKPYSDRLKRLNEVVAAICDHKKVLGIGNDIAESSSEVIGYYKQYLNKGYEGAMLKDPEGFYQWKRVTLKSGEMLKLKPFETKDLEVTGIYDGQGKNEGVAGGVVVDFNGVAVRCGSGFNDAMRKEMAEQPSKFIGKVAEIQYFEVTEDGSLRHPTFKRWREDKE